jgi:hypothetical protein
MSSFKTLSAHTVSSYLIFLFTVCLKITRLLETYHGLEEASVCVSTCGESDGEEILALY